MRWKHPYLRPCAISATHHELGYLLCPSYTRCLTHQTVPILYSRNSREMARRLCNDQRTILLESIVLPIKLSAHIMAQNTEHDSDT